MSTLLETAVAICDATCSRIYALDGMLAIAGAVVEISVSVKINVFFICALLLGWLLIKKPLKVFLLVVRRFRTIEKYCAAYSVYSQALLTNIGQEISFPTYKKHAKRRAKIILDAYCKGSDTPSSTRPLMTFEFYMKIHKKTINFFYNKYPAIFSGIFYSYRKLSIGFNFAAFIAGITPDDNPTITATDTDNTTGHILNGTL